MSSRVLILMSFAALLTGCNNTLPLEELQGPEVLNRGTPTQPSSPSTSPDGNPGSVPYGIGTPCSSADGKSFCVGLKYLVYRDSDGDPLVSDRTALKNLKTINHIWSQCQIAFQIDQYLPVDPNQYGLKFNTSDSDELDQIRKLFSDDSTFLVATTGTWDRDGTLGNTQANAWTAMPGESVYGVVLEGAIKTYANIIAHELGHYMNLDHEDDSSNLMNPIIYDSSLELTEDQCRTARATLKKYWEKMLH